MPSLRDLLNNLSTFRYYSGFGNFTANNQPYGKDRPGGGNSGQPYIIRRPGEKWGITGPGIGVPPFGAATTATRSVADVLRIGKFFLDPPKGALWLGLQTGLQAMNPKIDHTAGLSLKNDPTRIYNPSGITTLAQVGVNATGVHFNRHGLLPSTKSPDYAKTAEQNDRLKGLVTKWSDSENVKRYYLPLDKYVGGPGSFLGVGQTTINRSVKRDRESVFAASISSPGVRTGDSASDIKKAAPINFDTANQYNGFVPISISDITKISTDSTLLSIGENTGGIIPGVYGFNFNKADFRQYKKEKLNADITFTDYVRFNSEDRVGIIKSRYGTKNRKATAEQFGSSGSLSDYAVKGPTDSVNMVSLYKSAAPVVSNLVDVNGETVTAEKIRDFIKFRIKIYDNDTFPEGVYMVFRAFINSFSNAMNAKWEPYTYVGRGEEFYVYEGFNESYNLSYTIAALSRSEMRPLYQKLNYLKSSMAPDYSKANKMRGNIAELTVGDYVKYQPGVITNLQIDVPQEANWELAVDYLPGATGQGSTGKDSDMHDLPMLLNVSMTFLPIYNFLPRKSASRPFIGIDDFRRGEQIPINSDSIKNIPREWLRTNFDPK